MLETAASPYADDAILAAGANYWAERRGSKVMPTRREIDVLDMPREIIPYLVLAEFLSANGVVHYRVVGQEMVTRFGFNFSGKTSEEIFCGTYRVFLEETFALVFRERRPVYTESVFRWDAHGFARTRRLFMPLSETGINPTHVLIVQTWPDDPAFGGGALPRRTIVEIDKEQSHSRVLATIR